MNAETLIPISTIGKQAKPECSFLRSALVVWSAEDRSGDPYWWWLTGVRFRSSSVNLSLWNGGIDPECENGTTVLRERSESAVANSWREARAQLVQWSKDYSLSLRRW